ncbi:hypothetical protein BC829DRAFT_422152 [Chytridium lagenaria]|nr:hypothetical protein BC829DRAFT_422152 [Chytridium lagenaria]
MTGRRPLNMKKYAAIEGQEWTFIDVGDNETVTLVKNNFKRAAVWSNVLRQTVHTEESYMGGVGIKGWGSKGQGHPGVSTYATKSVPCQPLSGKPLNTVTGETLTKLIESVDGPEHVIGAIRDTFAVLVNQHLIKLSQSAPFLYSYLKKIGEEGLYNQKQLAKNESGSNSKVAGNTDPLHLSTAFASIGLENECHVDEDAMVNQAIKTDEAHGTCKHDWDRTAGNEEGKGIRNQRCTMALSISAQAYNAMATYPLVMISLITT